MSYFISIVLCGRNDNYGRDYLKRLQTLVGGIDYFCAQQALSCQLVFVEWNPPIDRPPIKSVIKWGNACRCQDHHRARPSRFPAPGQAREFGTARVHRQKCGCAPLRRPIRACLYFGLGFFTGPFPIPRPPPTRYRCRLSSNSNRCADSPRSRLARGGPPIMPPSGPQRGFGRRPLHHVAGGD